MGNEIYFGYDLLPQEALEHYGMPRRSGRYPWGSGEDPYHHGASAPGGKQRSNKPKSLSISERIKRRKAVKAAVEKAKAEAAAKQTKEEREKLKKEAIESGDPKRLAPFVRELSDAELKQASDRLRLENEFADRLAASSKYEKTAADKINAKLEKINNYTTTGIRAYNNFAMIANAFRGPDEQLPIVGANKKKDGDGEGKKKEKSESKNGGQSKNESKNTGQSEQKSKPTESKPQQEPNPKKEYVLPEALRNEKPTNSGPSEADLRKRWAEEANAAAERAKSAKAEEERIAAKVKADDLKYRRVNEQVVRDKWARQSNEAANRAKEAKRSEEVRELANEYSKRISMLEEARRRSNMADEASTIANQAKEAKRSEEVRELANEYAQRIAMLEEARRRKNMRFY